MPVGAGGRRELMQQIAGRPDLPGRYAERQSGGNGRWPGDAGLIQQPGFHADLAERTARLCAGLAAPPTQVWP